MDRIDVDDDADQMVKRLMHYLERQNNRSLVFCMGIFSEQGDGHMTMIHNVANVKQAMDMCEKMLQAAVSAQVDDIFETLQSDGQKPN